MTAAILVIGDEILSGRTKDKNIGYLAEYLTAIGIDLKEVRVVADDESAIVAAVNALRSRYDYLFTTGGIGPTHDDITADSVAKAFGVPIDHDARAVALLKERYAATGTEMNEARMRMTRIPAGAELVPNAVSAAPGSGSAMSLSWRACRRSCRRCSTRSRRSFATGVKIMSETVQADCREGDIGTELGEVAKSHPQVTIGSYPFFDPAAVRTPRS